MPDLAGLTAEFFSERIGTRFEVAGLPPETLTLTIAHVSRGGATPGPGLRAPFAVTFRGPTAPILAQRIHKLASPEVGVLELFLVPLGPDADGARYEAVFS